MRSKIGRGEGGVGSRLAFNEGAVGLVQSLEKSDEAGCDD